MIGDANLKVISVYFGKETFINYGFLDLNVLPAYKAVFTWFSFSKFS